MNNTQFINIVKWLVEGGRPSLTELRVTENQYNTIIDIIDKLPFEIDYYGYKKELKSRLILDRPPIGLKPRFIADSERLGEIQAAIRRDLDIPQRIPVEWVTEYNELIERLNKEI